MRWIARRSPMSDPFAKETYEAALSKHLIEIAPALKQIDARINRIARDGDIAEFKCLQTMRAILISGLFDGDRYLQNYPDVREGQMDPLEHYVRRGDREMRIPNAVFFPFYYRREFMPDLPADHNTLEHYIKVGEASGAQPNSAFDPQAYIAGNPGLAEFVDRPLFHYLEIGRPAGDDLRETRMLRILRPLLEYVYAHPWRNLLPEAKRSLVDGLGVHEGFARYTELIDQPDQAEIHLKQIASLRDISRANPLATYYETAPAGERFELPSPAVIGGDQPCSQTGYARSMFVSCLIDARVRAASSIIEFGEFALLDYQGDEMTHQEQRLEFDPSIFAADNDAAWIITPKGSAATIEIEEAFTMLGFYANHFGHWTIEYLPKYVAASLSGALPPVPVLIEANTSKSLRQALELVLPEGVDIIEIPPYTTANVRRLWCAPAPQHFPISAAYKQRFRWDYCNPSPERFARVAREIVRRADRALAPEAGPERVFLARSPNFARKLVNREAIEAIAQARGFMVAHPEQLDFADQFRLTRNARFVIGPDGSAMMLALFARPGTKICMLSFPDALITMPGWNGLFIALGMDLTVFTGSSARLDPDFREDSDYDIDEASFGRFLDRWLETGFDVRAVEGPGALHVAAPAGAASVQELRTEIGAGKRRPRDEVARSTSHRPPLVSIVCITYMHEKFALDALRSVLAQTYPMLDIIIVDDASPDGTADIIAAELARHRERADVRFIRNDQNLGAYGNACKGLSLAHGDFIVQFSGDDIMFPTMVDRMVEVWRETNVSLVTANVRYIDEVGQELNRFFHNPMEPYDETFETLARHCSNAVCFGAAMGFERRLYERFDWPPDYLGAYDIMLPFYAYLSKGARFIPEPLLKYRVHRQNLSMTLRYERSTNPIDKLLVWEEDRYLHLAHAFRMISELERLARAEPARFGEIELRIRPLLTALVHERTRQMVEARDQMHDLGVPVWRLRDAMSATHAFVEAPATTPLVLHEAEEPDTA